MKKFTFLIPQSVEWLGWVTSLGHFWHKMLKMKMKGSINSIVIILNIFFIWNSLIYHHIVVALCSHCWNLQALSELPQTTFALQILNRSVNILFRTIILLQCIVSAWTLRYTVGAARIANVKFDGHLWNSINLNSCCKCCGEKKARWIYCMIYLDTS